AETEEEINLRMSKAMAEISFINEYNYYIVNADLTESVGKMNAIVTAERSRVSQTVHHIIKEYREEI
ncbi:MAG: guanylate kinase, partial [Clostridiales bacterium]|nr:guanylate kinase [Clostridiales bacterium]